MNEGFRALPKEVQKKILGKAMGGVMQRPLFRQMGGPAEPMPQDMMQAPPMPQGMMQAQPDPQAMVQEAEMAGERVGEQIAAQTMTNIDSATDVKGAIDALRGNAAPLEARYQELAGFVGERDAMQTPESVLALTQPAIMMTEQGAMDSGIGELMQSVAGDSEMSGGMDQGVGALMMQGAGNTPPENFRQGGPVEVQRFAKGNEVVSRAETLQSDFLPLFEKIYGTAEDRQAELEKDRQLARSQMMFDIGKAGLAFAGETQGGSVAERLANALTRSGTFDSIGQRAAGLRALEKQADTQDQTARASALQTAISQAQTEAANRAAIELAEAKKKDKEPDLYVVEYGDGKSEPIDYNSDEGQKRLKAIQLEDPNAQIFKVPTQKISDPNLVTFYSLNDEGNVEIAGYVDKTAKDYQDKVKALEKNTPGGLLDEKLVKPFLEAQATELKDEISGVPMTFYTAMAPFTIERNGKSETIEAGQRIYLNLRDANKHSEKLSPTSDTVQIQTLYSKDGKESLDIVMDPAGVGRGLLEKKLGSGVWGTDSKKYDAFVQQDKELAVLKKKMELEREEGGNIEIRENAKGQLVVYDKKELAKGNDTPIATLGDPEVPDPDYHIFSYFDDEGRLVSVPEDVNSKIGQKLLAKVNQQATDGKNASMRKMPTAPTSIQTFLLPDGGGLVTSFDGGSTYVDENGVKQTTPGNAITVGDTIAVNVQKNERLRESAIKQLAEMETTIASGAEMFDADGNKVVASPAVQKEIIDAYAAARSGTGFWSKTGAMINAVLGGVLGIDNKKLIANEDSRQFVRMVRILGRSALASSPKYAVADLTTVQQLFPTEEAFFRNPTTEARKLLTLKTAINEEKARILNQIAGDTPIEKSQLTVMQQKLFEIDKLNRMLGPIEASYANDISEDAQNQASDIIKNAIKRGQNSGGPAPTIKLIDPNE